MESLKAFFVAVRDWIVGVEFSNPLVGLAAALVVAVLGFILVRIIAIIGRRMVARIEAGQGTRFTGFHWQEQEILSAEEISGLLTVVVKTIRFVAVFVVVVIAAGLILSFFAWTQRLALTALDLGISTLVEAGTAIVAYIPNFFLVAVIAAVAWYLVRMARMVFGGIASERIRLRGFYPEWAMPTFNLFRILVFVFALVMAFPYLPGAGSPAFQGISIFVGVLLSLGSTSAVANVVAGVVITYMRAFKVGDRVEIAETDGIVIERSLFVTRLRNRRNIEIAVPNSKVLASHIVNYSAMARTKGVFLKTSVGIGYDVDRRTVHDLLLAAARDTEGVAEELEPFVQQKELGDFAVVYELNAPTKRPHRFAAITSELQGNILDRFHDAGVEIMSPAYTAYRDGNRAAVPEVVPGPEV